MNHDSETFEQYQLRKAGSRLEFEQRQADGVVRAIADMAGLNRMLKVGPYSGLPPCGDATHHPACTHGVLKVNLADPRAPNRTKSIAELDPTLGHGPPRVPTPLLGDRTIQEIADDIAQRRGQLDALKALRAQLEWRDSIDVSLAKVGYLKHGPAGDAVVRLDALVVYQAVSERIKDLEAKLDALGQRCTDYARGK